MNWRPIKEDDYRLSLVNCTMLAKYDDERCKFCSRYGCTDRGYTVAPDGLDVNISEAEMTQQVMDSLDAVIAQSGLENCIHSVRCEVPECIRKLKKANVKAVLEKIKGCNDNCRRKGTPCAYRNEMSVCQRNVNPDGSTLVCQLDDDTYMDCPYHEKAFSECYRRKNDQCGDLLEKYDAPGNRDKLLILSHRYSAAPCIHCNEGSCTNAASKHNEGICVLNGLMAICDQYEPIGPENAYTEGVCTYVRSNDGKDDRKIFPSSSYADNLTSLDERFTLCAACRISHSIAKATGLKCLGVRRSASNPLLNEDNPLAEHAIQINYLYLTHPMDVAKSNPAVLAQAVFDGLTLNCKALECEEYPTCNFNPM